ncbi:hypothetical protein RSG36_003601 [Yersinia enterocolitica]|uniref:hypothetical protein n=1 Tax=Yersinia enterocolitica TaxID=630 RepID=UPI000A77180A|nr:hypothetical protein [Yersinia enterocolitica]EKN3896220.1 hypothetical protein [Yersinia enterocolitica]ELI8297200.1 hypothetical protein [Yersinia enterocolitica]HDL6486809.1 hypothetical protein [Yersinia enterocolitica]
MDYHNSFAACFLYSFGEEFWGRVLGKSFGEVLGKNEQKANKNSTSMLALL